MLEREGNYAPTSSAEVKKKLSHSFARDTRLDGAIVAET